MVPKLIFSWAIFAQRKVKVVRIDNLVTYGYGLKNPVTGFYSAQLQKGCTKNMK